MHILNSYIVLQSPNICFESMNRNPESLILGIKTARRIMECELVLVPTKIVTLWNQAKAIIGIGPLAKINFNMLKVHQYIAENLELLKLHGQNNVQFLNNMKKIINLPGNFEFFLSFNPQHKLYRLQWIHTVMENLNLSFSKSKLICSKVFRADEISEKANLTGLTAVVLCVINAIMEDPQPEKRKLISQILLDSLEDADNSNECLFFLDMTYVKKRFEYEFSPYSFNFQKFKSQSTFIHTLIKNDNLAIDEILKLGQELSLYIPCNQTVEIIRQSHDNLGLNWMDSLRRIFPFLADGNNLFNLDFILLFLKIGAKEREKKIQKLKELDANRFKILDFNRKKEIFLSLQYIDNISPVKKALKIAS